MYGFNPSAITEKLTRVPPEKISRSDRNSFWLNNAFSLIKSIEGTGRKAKTLNIKKINNVK